MDFARMFSPRPSLCPGSMRDRDHVRRDLCDHGAPRSGVTGAYATSSQTKQMRLDQDHHLL